MAMLNNQMVVVKDTQTKHMIAGYHTAPPCRYLRSIHSVMW